MRTDLVNSVVSLRGLTSLLALLSLLSLTAQEASTELRSGSALIDITPPRSGCDGELSLLEFEDCGVPAPTVLLQGLGMLEVGESITGICPGMLMLTLSDSSRFVTDHRLDMGNDTLSGQYLLEMECFDSTQYSPDILMYLLVKDDATKVALIGAKITVTDGRGGVTVFKQESTRELELFLPIDEQYTLTFEAEGYYTKILAVDARVNDPYAVGAGFSMDIALNMLTLKPGLDLEVLKRPLNKAIFDPEQRNFAWNLDQAEKVTEELDRLYYQR